MATRKYKLSRNITNDLYNLYIKTYKEDLNKWRDVSCFMYSSCLYCNYPHFNSRLSAVSVKVFIYKLILKFIWKTKAPRIVPIILKNHNNGGELALQISGFIVKLY